MSRITYVDPGVMSYDESLAANIAGLQHGPLPTPNPTDRIGLYLGNLAGVVGQNALPKTPLSRVEKYLAYICGVYNEYPYAPQNEIELYLAAIAGVYNGNLSEPQTRLGYLLKIIADNGEDYTLSSQWGEVITAYNTIERRFDGFRLFGKSRQRMYTGSNIFPEIIFDNIFTTNMGLRACITRDLCLAAFDGVYNVDYSGTRAVVFIDNVKFENGALYRCASDNPKLEPQFVLHYIDSSVKYVNGFVMSEEINTIQFRVILNIVNFKTGDEVHESGHIIITKNRADLTMEPYTGEKPSPNPDYPQDIVSVGESENLLDGVMWYPGFIEDTPGSIPDIVSDSSNPKAVYSDPIPLVTGKTYSFKTGKTHSSNYSLKTFSSSGVLISNDKEANSFVPAQNEDYCRIQYLDVAAADLTNDRFYVENTNITVQESGGNLFNIEDAAITKIPGVTIVKDESGFLINGILESPNTYHVFYSGNIKLVNGRYYISGYDNSPIGHTDAIITYHDGSTKTVQSGAILIDDSVKKSTIQIRFILVCKNGLVTYNDFHLSFQIFREATPYPPNVYKDIKSLNYPTLNGLLGIKIIDSLLPYYTPNYTDKNGVNWYCDEIDFARGVYIARLDRKRITLHKNVHSQYYNGYRYVTYPTEQDFSNALLETESIMLSSKFKYNINAGSANTKDNQPGIRINRDYNMAVAELYDTPIDEAPTTIETEIIYAITPIETPLSPEIIAKFQEFMMYGEVTQVYNDADAMMELKYRVKNVSKYRMQRRSSSRE